MARHKLKDKVGKITKLYQFNFIPKKINAEIMVKNIISGFISDGFKIQNKLFIHKLKSQTAFLDDL